MCKVVNVVVRAVFVIAAVSVGPLLSGCSALFGEDGFFRDRGDDYLKAESIPPLQVPDSVDRRLLGELFPIPPINKSEYDYPEEFEAPRPQALSSDIYQETVKIQSLGDERWIFINTSPSEVWPRVRYFLNRNRMVVDDTNAQQGMIETAWLQFKSDPDKRDKYRIIIEQGIQPDSSEIHVLHVSTAQIDDPPARINWPEKSTNKERESWLIDELANDLASDFGTNSAASLLAQAIGGDDRVSITSRGHEPILRVELEETRARATLRYSLGQGGFVTWEEDNKSDIFYLGYADPDDKPGFFKRLFGAGKLKEPPYKLVDIIDHMALDDTPENRALFPNSAFVKGAGHLKKVPGYLAILTRQPGAVELTLRDGYGRLLPAREARQLLGIIRSNLI